MKKWITLVAIAVLAVALVALMGCSSGGGTSSSSAAPSGGTSSGGASAGGDAVTIQNFSFSPASLTVKTGATVTWTNKDSVAHTVVGTDFKSDQIAPGATYTHAFTTAGSYDYHCSIHPSMTGTIIVQ